MGDLTKEAILKSNKQQWSSSAKIEAEGLEWLYTDPTAQKTNEDKLESYLLGESIPGARGELQKTNELESSAPGSLLRDENSARVFEQTLNKFREDPLFIIKKLEMQQKQVMDKYSAIASNFDRKRREFSRHSDKKSRDSDSDRRSRDRHDRRRRSRDHRRSSSHSRSPERRRYSPRRHDRDYDSHRKHRRGRDSRRSDDRRRDSHRRDDRRRDSRDRHDRRRHKERRHSSPEDTPRHSRSESHSPEADAKRKKGPEVPKKYNPLKYAFGVNDDICPPDAIMATARRREAEARARESERLQSDTTERDERSMLEAMRQEGTSHIKGKLETIAKLDFIESVTEKHEPKPASDFISAVKRKAFESADMAEMIRRKASKQQDPFNDNI